MKRGTLNQIFAVTALVASGVLFAACSQEKAVDTAPAAAFEEWKWVGVAEPVQLEGKTSQNIVFWASEDRTGSAQSHEAIYYSSMQRVGDKWVVADRHGLLFLDEKLQEQSRFDVGEKILRSQSRGKSSVNSSTALMIFNTQSAGEDQSFLALVVNDQGVHSVPMNDHPFGGRACEDGAAILVTKTYDGSGKIHVIRMDPAGSTTEATLQTPEHMDFSSGDQFLGCGEEPTYLTFVDESFGRHAYRLEGTWPEVTLEEKWDFGGQTPEAINRSSQILDGKLYSFTREGRIAVIDFENHEIHESELLLPPDTNPVSATVDGENIYIVTQPQGGARELRVHSFAFRNPQPSDSGFLLEGFFSLPHSTVKGYYPYAIPLSVYPAHR